MESRQQHTDEQSPLMGDIEERLDQPAVNTRPGWLGRIWGGIKTVGRFIAQNKLSTFLAFVTAAPNAINALAAPSGVNPANINSEWWAKLLPITKVYSIVSMASSFLINFIMHLLVLPLAWQKFRGAISDMRKGPWFAFKNGVALYFGSFGALAAGAIGYNSFLWLPYGKFTALPIAATNLLIHFATRFPSLIAVEDLAEGVLKGEISLQQHFAETLQHINHYELPLIEEQLQIIILRMEQNRALIGQPFDEDAYQKLTRKLSRRLTQLSQAHPDLIQKPVTHEYIIKYTGLLTCVTFALASATSGFMTFAQKGFDGVNILARLLANNPLDDMHPGFKALIGASPGFSTAIFYGKNSFDFPRIMTKLIKELYKKPIQIPAALGLLAANGFASASMNSVAQGVVNNPNNMFGLKLDTPGILYITGTTIAGATANTNNSINKAFLSPAPTSPEQISLPIFIQHLRDTENRLSPKTVQALRNFTHFQPPINTSVQDQNIPSDYANVAL